jgi:hypothetical protein
MHVYIVFFSHQLVCVHVSVSVCAHRVDQWIDGLKRLKANFSNSDCLAPLVIVCFGVMV